MEQKNRNSITVYHLHIVIEMSVTARWQWYGEIRSDGAFGSLSCYARFSVMYTNFHSLHYSHWEQRSSATISQQERRRKRKWNKAKQKVFISSNSVANPCCHQNLSFMFGKMCLPFPFVESLFSFFFASVFSYYFLSFISLVPNYVGNLLVGWCYCFCALAASYVMQRCNASGCHCNIHLVNVVQHANH